MSKESIVQAETQAANSFGALIAARWAAGHFVCVGLDPDPARLPPSLATLPITEALVAFNRAIVDATAEYAAAFKPNSAYYEWHGPAGLDALRQTCDDIRRRYPHIPVILDAKRGDIAETNRGYVASFFETFGVHAATLHPYLGRTSLAPFLERADKTFFILCRTSNPGAGEFQDLPVGAEGEPLYLRVAQQVAQEWNGTGNCGLVVGATYPAELARVRAAAPGLPILVPGVGAQGGTVADVLANGLDRQGAGVIISVSRAIVHASQGDDFAEAARAAAANLHRQVEEYSPQKH